MNGLSYIQKKDRIVDKSVFCIQPDKNLLKRIVS
jgi:hypothetical protein